MNSVMSIKFYLIAKLTDESKLYNQNLKKKTKKETEELNSPNDYSSRIQVQLSLLFNYSLTLLLLLLFSTVRLLMKRDAIHD